MGKYDEQVARAQQSLADAEAEYSAAVERMADAAPGVRDFVLGNIQSRIDEAKWMIETFSSAG